MEMEKNEAASTVTAAVETASEAARPPPSSSSSSPPAERAAIPLTWQQHYRGLKFSAELDTLWQRKCPHRHQDTDKTPSSSAAAAMDTASNGSSSGGAGGGAGQHRPVQVWFVVPFRLLCQICLALPLAGLVACLLMAVVFQFGDIQETACQVFNVVPSISAVTGISPGRYLWRVVIAFHLGPRLLIVSTYYHFLLTFLETVAKRQDKVPPASPPPQTSISPSKDSATATAPDGDAADDPVARLAKLLKAIYYLQLVEIVGLVLISFIHNREHYPIHEKGFLLYLSSSHASFLLILVVYWLLWADLGERQRNSFRRKAAAFAFSILGLAMMAYFYYRHIVHCDTLAFSIFAFVEYFVAAANMFFYWTILDDLPDEEIVVLKPIAIGATADGKDAAPASNGHCLQKMPNDLASEAKKDQ